MKKALFTIFMSISFFEISAQTAEDISSFSRSYEMEYALNYAKAIETIQVIYDENSYGKNLRLGWLHYLNGNYIKSRDFYKKAISLKPKSAEARLGLVFPLSAVGNWDEVIRVYEEILVLDANNYTVNYRMGLIYYNRNDFTRSYSYIKKVIDLYPFDYDLNLLFGKINVSLGKINEARAAFSQALLINTLSVEAAEALKKL